jgi:cation diffusion facilitator family transporter
MHTRFVKIRNILLVILFLNWLVAVAKIFYGIITRAASITADGFHSFSDGASNLIGLAGIWAASQPVDRDHPYGHKKYETFSAVIISILLFIISFNIIRGGIIRFLNPVMPDITGISFFVMIMTMAVNTGVYLYEKKQSHLLSSDILAADSYHTRSDILVSLSVIFTLIAVKAGFPAVDSIVSILIALLIAYSGIGILRESSGVLCDKTVIEETLIKDIVLSVKGVRGCHNIRTRGRADDVHLDLHIEVDSSMAIGTAHKLSHQVEDILKHSLKGVTDIAMHIEPFPQ